MQPVSFDAVTLFGKAAPWRADGMVLGGLGIGVEILGIILPGEIQDSLQAFFDGLAVQPQQGPVPNREAAGFLEYQ